MMIILTMSNNNNNNDGNNEFHYIKQQAASFHVLCRRIKILTNLKKAFIGWKVKVFKIDKIYKK